MHPAVADPGLFEELLPVGPVGPRVDRLSGLSGEDPAALGPRTAGVDPLDILRVLMLGQEGDELWG